MKPLIDEDSILYKKRLVRELNQEGMLNGFYDHKGRCNRARLVFGGALEVRSSGGGWRLPQGPSFFDAYGRNIVASRSPR